jgi:hypothetical protein
VVDPSLKSPPRLDALLAEKEGSHVAEPYVGPA